MRKLRIVAKTKAILMSIIGFVLLACSSTKAESVNLFTLEGFNKILETKDANLSLYREAAGQKVFERANISLFQDGNYFSTILQLKDINQNLVELILAPIAGNYSPDNVLAGIKNTDKNLLFKTDNFSTASFEGLEFEIVLTPSSDVCIPTGDQVISVLPDNMAGIYTYEWNTGELTADITVTPTETTTYSVTVTEEQGCVREASVRIVECSSIGNQVWFDITQDGINQSFEPGIPDVTVSLLDKDGLAVDDPTMMGEPWTVITDSEGVYSFDNITPDMDDDTFFVSFLLDPTLNGLQPSSIQNPGVNSNGAIDTDLDSDIDLPSSTSPNFVSGEIILSQDEVLPNIDAGIVGNDTIGNFVFTDINGNGLQDAEDIGISGVEVYLKLNGVFIDTTITGPDGKYEFVDLVANASFEYAVQFSQPSGYFATFSNVGMDDALDSDADTSMMLMSSGLTFVNVSEYDSTFDAGFFEAVSVGDTAFIDTDFDGLQDEFDPPLQDVTVNLFRYDDQLAAFSPLLFDNAKNPISPQITDANGAYLFENLPPGQYYVNFDAGQRPVTTQNANANANDDIDSDINTDGDSDAALVSSGSINLNFDAGYQGVDFGDLPEEYVTSNAGSMGEAAKHVIRDGIFLGSLVDSESDGSPSQDGLGDDDLISPFSFPSGLTGNDEDGIELISPMIPGNIAYVQIRYTSASNAFINAFLDFNGDMNLEAIEFVSIDGSEITPTSNLGIGSGSDQTIVAGFNVPETATFRNGLAYSRFRLSTEGNLSADGLTLDGEVEDHVFVLGKLGNLVWLDENFDGLQDPSSPEQVLANVPIVLSYNITANAIEFEINDTLSTDVNGLYSFCGLLSSDEGRYQITLLTPDGLAGTMADQGDDQLDSDNTIEYGEEGRDSIQTEPFRITDVANLPTEEIGQGDDPNTLNGFPDNQFDQSFDFGLVPIDFGDLPQMDFGDLPIGFATTEEGNVDPPRHIVTSNKRLGSCIDSELDGQPDEMGMGDDDNMASGSDNQFMFGTCSDNGSDEDGIEFLTPMIPGDTAYIRVTYTMPAPETGNVAGYLKGWIDFDGDGLLRNNANLGPETDDRIFLFKTSGPAAGISTATTSLRAGDDEVLILGFEVPETATFNGGTAFTRFRLSCERGLLPVGILQSGDIPEGEVEDYVVPLTKIGNLVWLDQNFDGIQDTSQLSVERGIADVPVSLTYTYFDDENGIDLTIQVDTVTDENGKYKFCGLLPTDIGEYKITVTSPESFTPTVANNSSVSDSLDSDQMVNMGDTIVMTDLFRIPSSSGLPLMEDGIQDDPNLLGTFPDSLFDQSYDFGFVPLDYGDLDSTSFATVKGDNGAIHVISETKFLGLGVDAEIEAAADTIAGAGLDGDDNTGSAFSLPSGMSLGDDEDGIQFITPLIPGFKATISVVYNLEGEDGYLNGWIDFNGNGILDPSEALVFYTDSQAPSTDALLSMGSNQTIELNFDVPEDAVYNEGDVHARFRLSCDGGLEPSGGFADPEPDGPQAPQGEVEDYYLPLGKIGNLAFFDNDLDGSQDGNAGINPEIGIEGVNNTLVFAGFGSSGFGDGDEIEYPVTTDVNGNYYVCGLIPGAYDMIPTKYLEDAITPEDTIPVRYILTAANCDADDDLDSDFIPNYTFTIPDLLTNDLVIGEDAYTDDPGNVGFPDEQDQVNIDQGWIPEPNIEAIANIAGVDYPTSGQCRQFNVIADVCIQNTGFVEMNGELIGASLENIDIDIDLGEQFMGAFVGVIGDPIILDTVEYEEAFMLVNDDDAPSENPDFDGLTDIDGSLIDGIIEPSEIVCLRIMFEIAPDELTEVDAMNLSFNAVVSGMAINEDGKELPDYFNGGQQFVAVDSSDRIFMFDGTYEDPDAPEPLTDCYETTKDLSVHSLVNLSYDETCMALITPQMMLTQMDMSCDNDDYPLGGYYRLQLEDLNGNVIIPYTDSLLLEDPAFIGNMFNVSVQTVSETCNSAWGKITVENKYPPIIECANDTISCGELLVLDPPTVLNNCGEINLTLLDRSTVDVACEDPNLQLIVTETWIAIDPNGLRSDTCTQTLSVEKFDINDVDAPITTDTILNCSIGTMPSPEALGVPSLNGVPLYPDNFAECGIFVDYEDDFFSFGNDCSSGVQRTWIVQNWICGTDNSVTFTQLITFVDTTGPVLSDIPGDITLTTSGFDCTAQVEVPAIGTSDDCNPDDIRVDINYEGGFQMNSNGGTIELPVGSSTVTYIVYDVCGNTSTASYNVTIQDLQQPVTICDAFTVVSLNSEGLASLSAEKLDNGSMDECGPVDLAIRRMDDNLGFMEEVDFSCADIGGGNIMVALRVTDISGNANTCMAEVELQDKVPPVLVSGLPDITISCTFPFDMDNLSVFGTVVNHVDSIKEIIIDDAAVQFSGPAQDGLILDNCTTAEMSEITSGDLDNCGNGTLVRTIIATSPNGEQISLSQKITLVNPTPFLESDITWPDDITLTQCTDAGLNPINFPEGQGFPLYEEDNCDLVSSSYEDRILSNTPNGGGCLLIERTWYVSDWCQRRNDLFVIFEDVQLITIINEVAPVITSECEDIRVESIDAECGDVFVNLTASATDDCVMSENLIWEYEIDAFSDGTIDIEGSGNDASGTYPVGVHQIRFLVGDGCGNISECVYSFELVNTKPATPLCFQGLSAALTPMDTIGDSDPDAELFMLTPDFLDAGSFHSCGYDLQLSFSSDVNDTLRIFGCEDLGQQAIQLWVTDPTGNQDFCATFIIVEDNNEVDICPPTSELVDVSGNLFTEEQVHLGAMEVYIADTDLRSITNENGAYNFGDMPKGGDYTIEPIMDLDHRNGVTTLDLIMIQKHILGITPITSPYKLLAADVNGNGMVTGSDLLEMRKLILGLYDRFPSNTSWRFVDAGYDFIDPTNPWSQTIPETYDIYNLSSDMTINFVGLKVGDLNGSVEVQGQPLMAEDRSQEEAFVFTYDDLLISKGETVFIPFYGDKINEIIGYQFTLEIDNSKAVLEGVESVSPGLTDLNFGDRYMDIGYLTSSWNRDDEVVMNSDEALFGIQVTALEDMNLSDVISLSGEIARSEAYTKRGELVDVEFDLREGSEELQRQIVLNQNKPNPWIKNTVISFSFPEATDATIRIFDVTGKLVKVHRSAYEAGVHEYELIEQDFSSRGVYYYELITDEFKQSKKMVLIK